MAPIKPPTPKVSTPSLFLCVSLPPLSNSNLLAIGEVSESGVCLVFTKKLHECLRHCNLSPPLSLAVWVCVCVCAWFPCACEAAIFSMEPINTRRTANAWTAFSFIWGRNFSCQAQLKSCSYACPWNVAHSNTHIHGHNCGASNSQWLYAASTELWPCVFTCAAATTIATTCHKMSAGQGNALHQ